MPHVIAQTDDLAKIIEHMEKNRLIKNYAYYLGSSIGSLPINFIKNLFLARMLFPAEYGLLATLNLFIPYARLGQLGILNVFDMRYPALQSQKKDVESWEMLNTSFSLLMVVAMLFSGSCILYGIVTYSQSRESSWSFGLLVFGLVLFFDEAFEFILVYFRTQNMFGKLSFMRFLFNVVIAIFSILGVYWYGLNGAIVGSGVTFILFGSYGLYHYVVNVGGSFSISRNLVVPLFSAGFPFLATQVTSTVAGTLDRIIILAFFSTAGLGIYSNAMLYAGLLVTSGAAVSYVINPTVVRFQATQPDKKILGRIFVVPFKTLKYALPMVQLLSWLMVPYIILLLTPKYADSAGVVKIMVFGTSYGMVMAYCAVFYVALSRQWEMMGIGIVSTVVMIGSLGFAGWIGGDLETMALAMVIAQIGNVAFCQYATCRTFYSAKQSIWYIVQMQSLQVVVFLFVLIVQHFLPLQTAGVVVVVLLICAALGLLAFREAVRGLRDVKLLINTAKP